MIFVDWADASAGSPARLRDLQGADVVVLGLPRGGVVTVGPRGHA